jgi:uncharacterized Rmd1/YagE family protein
MAVWSARPHLLSLCRMFLQYGVSIFWGMTDARCRHLLDTVGKACELAPLAPQECAPYLPGLQNMLR